MIRPITLVLMVTALLSGCASYYDDQYDDYGYGDTYGYDDSYVVDEVVYGGGHSYGGFGGVVGGGLGYAHDPYWRSSAFSLFYSDFPSYYVWSPYRQHYPGFGQNFGFGFGNGFVGVNRFNRFDRFGFGNGFFGGGFDQFGFGHYSPIFGYTYRPRFSYFGLYSPRFYSPTYFRDYDRRDRRFVVRTQRPPSALNEARRLTRNSRPGVFAQRSPANQGLLGKGLASATPANSRTAANRRTLSPTVSNRSAPTVRSTNRQRAPVTRSGTNSRGLLRANSGAAQKPAQSTSTRGQTRSQASGQARSQTRGQTGVQTRGQTSASRATRVLQPTSRASSRASSTSSSTQRLNAINAGRPAKLEQGGRALVTRPTVNRQSLQAPRVTRSQSSTSSRATQRSAVQPSSSVRQRSTRSTSSRPAASPQQRATVPARTSASSSTRSSGRTSGGPVTRPQSRQQPSTQSVNRSAPRSSPSAARAPQARQGAPARSAQKAAPQRQSRGSSSRSRSNGRGRDGN